MPLLLWSPSPHGLGDRDQQRAGAAQNRRDPEREYRRHRRGQQRHEQRSDDEGDLLQRGFQRVRGRPQLAVGEHPRPKRAKRGADGRHQRSRGSCSRADQRQRGVEERQDAHTGEQRREDHAPGEQDSRLPPTIDTTSRDRSPDRRRHEVAAGDEAGGRVAAPVFADEQQQRQPDHPRGQPCEHPAEHEPAHVRDAEQGAVAREAERRDGFRHEIDHLRSALMKVEPLLYGDKKVFTVAGFNRGVADWLTRLPTLWIEGEVTELRRNANWGSVFFTLKDPDDGACLPASIPRRTFDALKLDLAEGERIHVLGRPELFAAKGEFRLRALSLERFGLGEHLAAIERLKQTLAAEGLFDASRKRALPRFPRRIGLVTGSDAAARRDVISTIQIRFPPARVLVAETLVQGPRAAAGIVEALQALAAEPGIDVIVLTRGGGSFDDLLPFSDERVVRAVASCPVPVVSAVGHEQDTPLCDLAADVRASTPTAAGKLVVPDFEALRVELTRARSSLERCVRRATERERERLVRTRSALERGARKTLDRDHRRMTALGERLRRSPALLLERRRSAIERAEGRLTALSPRATLGRGYAIVRSGDAVLRNTAGLAPGTAVEVELAEGAFGARVEDVRE